MGSKIKKVEDPHAKVSLHLSVENWIKNLIPSDKIASQEISQFVIARWGAPRKAIEQVIVDIQKKKEERLRVESELMALEHRREEMDLEQQRQEEQIALIEMDKKYARYILLKEILSGPVISKQKAIQLAHGVKVTGEVLSWCTMVRRKFFSNGLGTELPNQDTEPFLRYLKDHFIEVYPGISYVGRGEREKENKQEFRDVVSESKRLCSLGHTYDSLKDRCPECTRVYQHPANYLIGNVPTLHLRFANGGFVDYFSDLTIAEGYRKLESKLELGASQVHLAIDAGNGGQT